jgi:hypothetical protein
MRRATPRRDASIKPAGDMSRRSSWIPAMPTLGRPWAVFRHNNSSTTLRGRSFETAIRADPNLPDPYTPLAIILQSAHEWEALVETTNRLLQLDAYRYPIAWLLNATGH